MSHVERRKAEIAAGAHKPKPRARPVKRRVLDVLQPTDADVLRFIAKRLRDQGMVNFATELERIATAASVPAP